MSMTFRIQVCYSKYYYVFKSRENFGQTLKLDTQSNLSIITFEVIFLGQSLLTYYLQLISIANWTYPQNIRQTSVA